MTPLTCNMDFIPLLPTLPKVDSRLRIDVDQGWIFKTKDWEALEEIVDDDEETNKNIKADQRAFIRELFNIGQQKNSQKIKPEEAREKMKLAKTEDGIRRFSRQQWLTKNQIRSLYGRFAAELRHKTSKPSREMIENEVAEEERQLRVDIVEKIANSVAEPEKLSEQSCPLMVSHIQFKDQTKYIIGTKNTIAPYFSGKWIQYL